MQVKDILHLWLDELTDQQHFANKAALGNIIRCALGQRRTTLRSNGH